MQISLRSQMIAGVAAVGVTAIAVTPIVQAEVIPSMQRVSAAVQLSSISNPIAAVGAVLENLNANIFSGFSLGNYYGATVDFPLPAAFADGTGYSFYGYYETCADAVACAPATLDTLLSVNAEYSPGFAGVIPDFVNQFSYGTIAAMVGNTSEYAQALLSIPLSFGNATSTAVFNTPGALVTAVQQLIAGDTQAALATLKTEILDPLSTGLTQIANAVGYVLDNSIANIQTVASTVIPGVLRDVITQVQNGAVYMSTYALQTVKQVITDIAGGKFTQAWNNAVDGFLGPNGTLGQFESLTAGIGIGDYDEAGTTYTVFAPSIRSVLTGWGQRVGDYRNVGIEVTQTGGYPKIVTGSGCVADAGGATGTCAQGGILNDFPFTPFVAAPVPAASTRAARSAAAVAGKTTTPAVTPASEPSAPAAAEASSSATAAAEASSSAPAAAEASSSARRTAGAPKSGRHSQSRKAVKAAAAAN